MRGVLELVWWAVSHPWRAAGYLVQLLRLLWVYSAGDRLDVAMFRGQVATARRRAGHPGSRR